MMISNSFEEEKNTIDLLKNLYIPIPEGFDEFINAKIEEGMALAENNEKKQRHLSKGMIAVLVAIMILAIGVTVTASMDYYHKRMNMLSDKELEELLKAVDSSDAEVFSYSRPLSEEEQNRTIMLREKYLSEGLFPEKEHKIINSLEEVRKDEVAFYAPKSFYYLPERVLNDEELLEMIDYLFKADYALGNRAMEEAMKKEALPEEELIRITKEYVENLFDIELKDYSYSVRRLMAMFGFEGDDEVDFKIILKDKNSSFECTTTIVGNNGRILYVETPQTEKIDVSFNAEECKRVALGLKEKFLTSHYKNETIEKIYVKTELNSPTVIDGEHIICLYKLRNGNWVNIIYGLNAKRVKSISYCTTSAGVEDMDKRELEKCRKNNFEYKVLEVEDE